MTKEASLYGEKLHFDWVLKTPLKKVDEIFLIFYIS